MKAATCHPAPTLVRVPGGADGRPDLRADAADVRQQLVIARARRARGRPRAEEAWTAPARRAAPAHIRPARPTPSTTGVLHRPIPASCRHGDVRRSAKRDCTCGHGGSAPGIPSRRCPGAQATGSTRASSCACPARAWPPATTKPSSSRPSTTAAARIPRCFRMARWWPSLRPSFASPSPRAARPPATSAERRALTLCLVGPDGAAYVKAAAHALPAPSLAEEGLAAFEAHVEEVLVDAPAAGEKARLTSGITFVSDDPRGQARAGAARLDALRGLRA